MNKRLETYIDASTFIQNYLEEILERKLFLSEFNAIRNFGGGMMLESFDMSISNAKTKEQAEYVLTDLISMNRLENYVLHYNNYIINKGFNPNSEFDAIVIKKGNCIDLMKLMDQIGENRISKESFDHEVEKLIQNLFHR